MADRELDDFLVELTVEVRGRDGTATMTSRLRMPFAPFAGLTITDGDDQFTVRSVEWKIGDDLITCHLYDAQDKLVSVQDLISRYTGLRFCLCKGSVRLFAGATP